MMTTDYATTRDGRRIEVETLPSRVTSRRRRADRHIGCPVEWLKRVLPLVQSKEQLAIAIWLHRRHVICRSDLFTVPNEVLREDLGLSRYVKYKALRHLEQARVIAVTRNGNQALGVRLVSVAKLVDFERRRVSYGDFMGITVLSCG
jgi:hypothetical protein